MRDVLSVLTNRKKGISLISPKFALPIAATALGILTACGSSSGSSSAPAGGTGSESTSSASSTASSSAPSTGGTIDKTPTEADLLPAVQALIDPKISPTDKAASVIGGNDLEATFVSLDKYIAEGPAVTFKISDPQVVGNTVNAKVQISSGGQTLPDLYPSVWQKSSSGFQLTRTGACALIAVSGITCPDAATS